MKRNSPTALFLAALCAGAAGCEQEEQKLPFTVAEEAQSEAVVRTISQQGGTVSTSAGVSLQIPPNAVQTSTQVTVQPQSGSDVGAKVDGRVLAGTIFKLMPEGQALGAAARLDMRADPGKFSDAEALALAGVQVVGGVASSLNDASIDLHAGILRTSIDRLGTVAVRVAEDVIRPTASAPPPKGGPIFSLAPPGAAGASALITYRARCGGPASSCTQGPDAMLSVLITPNLQSHFENQMAFLPDSARGELIFNSNNYTMQGAIEAWGYLRARAGNAVGSKFETSRIVTGTETGPPLPVPVDIDEKKASIRFLGKTLRYTADGTSLTLRMPPNTVTFRRTVTLADGTTQTVEDTGVFEAVIRLRRVQ